MSNAVILRLSREISEFQRNPEHQIYLHFGMPMHMALSRLQLSPSPSIHNNGSGNGQAPLLDDSDVMNIKAMITGPPGTPYCLGLFEFSLQFPRDYPTCPPRVLALTTNYGRTRFNPNIYAAGKVCLSILGTWRGEAGEQWSSAHGIVSILLSIQSLMSDNPYRNEPGHDQEKDEKKLGPYNDKIRHETIRISVCDRLEGYLNLTPPIVTPTESSSSPSASPVQQGSPKTPETGLTTPASTPVAKTAPSAAAATTTTTTTATNAGSTGTSSTTWQTPETLYASNSVQGSEFSDLSKRLFLCYYDIYQDIVDNESARIKDGTEFYKAGFEFGGNKMDGKFNYASLRSRLVQIKDAINEETRQWTQCSKEWIESSNISSNLQRQFEQVREYYRENDSGGIEVELVNGNPYEWNFTLFGPPMSNYDGGMFKVELVFSNQFPEVQPRARFVTPMYHVHVNSDGVPIYSVTRSDDVRSHIEAIRDMIVREDPKPIPSTHINVEASKLYFGTKEQKREYSRNARRCASRSLDYFE
ncbi:hypothetical protein BGZ73_002255 [Actinomortierella ambigua]|nr:hypothetical protein BGZ73_002255 [Actinomortierella ambigua]